MAYGSTPNAAHPDTLTVVADNVVESASGLIGRWTATGGMTDASLTHPDYPITAAFDRFLTVDTRPVSAAALHYLNLRARSAGGAGGDTLMIAGHNLSGCDVRVETADNDAFSTNLATIHNFGTVAQTSRLIAVLPDFWFGLDRLRIRVSFPVSGTPQISEFLFGPRRVLPRNPDVPYDDQELFSDVDKIRSKGGVQVNYAEGALGIRRLPVKMTFDEPTALSTWRTIFRETSYGHKQFLVIDKPNSVPGTGYWMDWQDPQLAARAIEAQIRNVSTQFIECAPLVSQGAQ